MASKLELITPVTSAVAPINVPTDWSKCVICQEQNAETLRCPAIPKRKNIGAIYAGLAEDLMFCTDNGCLPEQLDVSKLNEGDGIEATFQRHSAKFHATCRLQLSKIALKRTVKRKHPGEQSTCNSKKKKPGSQRNSPCETDYSVCLFCEKPDSPSQPLHKAISFGMSQRVQRCASELIEESLMSKVSCGDLGGSDAKYHAKCLATLYNTARNQAAESVHKEAFACAFADLVKSIEDTLSERHIKNTSPVFKLADLTKMHNERLVQLGVTDKCVHATRLKDKLLAQFPELRDFKEGRDVLLVASDDIGANLRKAFENNDDDAAITLARAARIVREDVMNTKTQFSGSFSKNCQVDAVPRSLATLVAMLLHGDNIKEQVYETHTRGFLSICQLVMFNTTKECHKQIQGSRHDKSREPPLPVYLGVLIHNKTRKRELVEKLFDLGLSVSYDRVLEISTKAGTEICKYYNQLNTVCPPQLKKNVFTTAAVDNINHQPSSTTANSAFNGTGISIFQHPSSIDETTAELEAIIELPVIDNNIEKATSVTKKGIPKLPASYTHVPPLPEDKLSSRIPQTDGSLISNGLHVSPPLQVEFRWLQHVHLAMQGGQETANISWSAFHAESEQTNSKGTQEEAQLTTSCLLPLFNEDAATVSMMRHSLDVIRKVTELTHPGQVPVVEMDQPLFALAKNIQWKWPSTYGESKFVIMFGGLHIELAALKTLGNLLEGSGWTSWLVQSGVATSGKADSFLKASHITRTRRAHQITACAIYHALQEAYESYAGSVGTNLLSQDDWCKKEQKDQPLFNFWLNVLQLQLTVLGFIRSIRSGDFHMYVDSLSKLVPWFFALDRSNYARWIPVHIRDMLTLPKQHPSVYDQFLKGHFTVKKTMNAFSRMAMDQAHEQNNAVVKDDGGAVGLTENSSALQRWMVSGPEMARLINEFETSVDEALRTHERRHHEQRPGKQKAFLKDVKAMKDTLHVYGNPFQESSGDLLVLDTKDVINKSAWNVIAEMEDIGCQQYNTFVQERLIDRSKSLEDSIKKNKLCIFDSSKTTKKTKTQEQVAVLKNDVHLFSRLYVACAVRDGNIDEFFAHENQNCPPSLSVSGKIRQGKKSDIVRCLEESVQENDYVTHDVDVIVLDGPAITHMLKPGSAKTFQEYAQDIFIPYIEMQLSKSERVDIIWDRYTPDSLKQQTRHHRGKGIRRRVQPQNAIPKNWGEFLRVDENKSELFAYLSSEVASIPTNKQIISTLSDGVVCRLPRSLEGISPCSHEEADTRIMLHVADAATQYKNVLIRTVDSDVVVLAVYTFAQLLSSLSTLWVAYGTGKDFRLIAVHNIYAAIGREKSLTLPFFHAVTGCDTVSAFAGRGKKTAWDIWHLYPEVTTVFAELMDQPHLNQVQDAMAILQRFVILLYDKSSTKNLVNDARVDLFTRKGRDVAGIPPSQGALLQHVRRAAYQAGICWSQSLLPLMNLPSPEGWGWTNANEGSWEVVWTTLPEASKVCEELLHCGCTKGCQKHCKCAKASLTCTALCKCGGSCSTGKKS